MSANPRLGYVKGERLPVACPVDASTTAIVVGDMLTLGTAGYVQQLAAGDIPYGVAMDPCAVPSADGALSVLVDISKEVIYRYVPDTGSVTAGLLFTTMDTGGPQSINIDATTDNSVRCVGVDVAANTLLIKLA